VLLPDKGIWHPLAPRVFENAEEYMAWYDREHAPAADIDVKTAPTIGVILQKSHINTKVDNADISLDYLVEFVRENVT